MPTLNKVGKPKATASVAEPVMESKAEITPLKDIATVKVGNMNLPAFLAGDDNSGPTLAMSDMSGFLGFAHSMSPNWLAQQGAGLEEGQPFVMVGGQYIVCDPLEYVMLQGKSFRTWMEGRDMKLMYASEDVDNPDAPDKAEPHYVCLMLVKTDNGLEPIVADVRGTKAGIAEKSFATVAAAATADWPKLSDAHKVSCAFPQPWGRVWNVGKTEGKIGKTSGNKYYRGLCNSKPANATQIQMLIDVFADQVFVNKLNKAKETYDGRVKVLVDFANK